MGRRRCAKGGGALRSLLAGAWWRRVCSSGEIRVPLNGSGLSIPVSIWARSCPQAARPAGDREVNRAITRLIDVATARGDEKAAQRYQSMLRTRERSQSPVTGAAGN